jgi:hypothetical protein
MKHLPAVESGSFLKKEPENFCGMGLVLSGMAAAKDNHMFFASFFQKSSPS